MNELLAFMGDHPILTILLALIITGTVVQLVRGYEPPG